MTLAPSEQLELFDLSAAPIAACTGNPPADGPGAAQWPWKAPSTPQHALGAP